MILWLSVKFYGHYRSFSDLFFDKWSVKEVMPKSKFRNLMKNQCINRNFITYVLMTDFLLTQIMKLNSLFSVRSLLILSAVLPLFLVATKPGLAEDAPTLSNSSSVSPSLKQKLQKLAPVGSIVNPGGNGAAFVQESGPSWVEYIQHKSSFQDIRVNPATRPNAGQVFEQIQR